MSNEAVPAVRFRRRRTAVAVAALAVAAIAAWQLPIYLSARAALREGLAALERDEPEAARRHFEKCLEAWPDSAEANYRAAQAARRSGDLDAATAFLLQANLHGCPAPDVEVEAALIKTQSGNLAVAESALLHHLQEGHAEDRKSVV